MPEIKHQLIHACAGSGKTQHIVDRCASTPETRRVIITYTTTGQEEIARRLKGIPGLRETKWEVLGWYAFLLKHVVRPYLPKLFRNIRARGLVKAQEYFKDINPYKASDSKRFFTEKGGVYTEYLEELSYLVMSKYENLVVGRLNLLYDEIIIDEVQDITRSGLNVIKVLLNQRESHVLLVGDSRQSIFATNRTSQSNRKADKQHLLKWYRDFEKQGVLDVLEKVESYRFNQEIADFSDQIFSSEFGFSRTESLMRTRTEHDGVFLVNKKDFDVYYAQFRPVILRHSKESWKELDEFSPINFGMAKGLTFDRVAVAATKPIQDFLVRGQRLKDMSACAFYVAVTRARYSVAIIVDIPENRLPWDDVGGVQIWEGSELGMLF